MSWKWTDERIDEAVEILSQESRVVDALEVMSKKFGRNISRHALRNAFKRKEIGTPNDYLKGGSNEEEEQESTDLWTEGRQSKRFNWEDTDYGKQEYVFHYEFDDYHISFQEMEDILIMYSKTASGMNMTSPEIAQEYSIQGKPWAHEDFIAWMLRTIGFHKRHFPVPPHKMFSSHEEILKSVYNRRNALIARDSSAGIIKHQQDEITDLSNRLLELERVVSVAGQTLDDTVSYKIPSGKKEISGNYKVLVIPLTDLHNGKFVEELPLSKRQNVFNEGVFNKRIDAICELITQVNYQPDKVHIAGLGDYFEALLANMRPYQFKDMDNYGAVQYKNVKDAWVKVIETAFQTFKDSDIFVTVQGGNHDRLTEDRGAKTEEVLAFILAENLKDLFRDRDRVVIHFGTSIVSTMYENGVNHITTHGHVGPKLRNHKDIQNFIRIHGFQEAKRYVVSIGHYHSTEIMTGYKYRVYKHSSVCGDDRYNLETLSLGSPPEIMFSMICDKHDRVDGPYNLRELE